MHNGALRKWALALTFWLALHFSSLKAQIFENDLPLQAYTTGTNPVDFEFRSDGTMIAKGDFGVGSLLSGDQGQGTRLLWFPSLAAFRAGYVYASEWDASHIGAYSTAFGASTTASGTYSTAFGKGSNALGVASTAIGKATASGVYSTAMGGASASGNYSMATGGATVAGNAATGFGSSFASGSESLSMGTSTASGYGALAGGFSTTAYGTYSTAFNVLTTASGYATFSAGAHTTAAADLSFTIGTYNVGGGSQTTWVPTDPLFEVGNGTSSAPSDAMVVYKNGIVAVHTEIRTSAAGDLSMGSFTAGTQP